MRIMTMVLLACGGMLGSCSEKNNAPSPNVVRLMKAGVEPRQLALMAARYDAEHAEYGAGHALPIAVDVLHLTDAYPGLRAALPLLQAFEIAADTCVRLPKRAARAPSDPGSSVSEAGRKLRRLVEEEQADGAEALVRGALARGWGPEVIEPWLLGLCADHFLGFGHGLIYTIKDFDLLATVGWRHAPEIVPGLLFSLINQTREELLPEWRRFRKRLAAVQPRLAAFAVVRDGQPPAGYNESLVQAILDGSREEAFDCVAEAMNSGCHVDSIVDALSVAASERILRFDVAIDGDCAVQEGWLAVTHPFTFVNAARCAVQRYADPRALILLFQAAGSSTMPSRSTQRPCRHPPPRRLPSMSPRIWWPARSARSNRRSPSHSAGSISPRTRIHGPSSGPCTPSPSKIAQCGPSW